MLKETLLTSLKAAISDVLETMFFQPVQIDDSHHDLKEWLSEDPHHLGARLGFSGPITGTCYVLVPDQGGAEMAANFLGIEEEALQREQVVDTVKEALNMIGGRMLALCDESGAFHLDIPEIADTDAVSADLLGDAEGSILFLETADNRLLAGLTIT